MEKDAATVLEDAADLLLIHGRAQLEGMDKHGAYCVLGAIKAAADEEDAAEWYRLDSRAARVAVMAVARWLPPRAKGVPRDRKVYEWNDGCDDDFEVIDTLRHVAKDLRNQAVV